MPTTITTATAQTVTEEAATTTTASIPANEDPFKKAQATAARAGDVSSCPFETGKGTLGKSWEDFDTGNLEFVLANIAGLQAQFPSLTNAHLDHIRGIMAARGEQKA